MKRILGVTGFVLVACGGSHAEPAQPEGPERSESAANAEPAPEATPEVTSAETPEVTSAETGEPAPSLTPLEFVLVRRSAELFAAPNSDERAQNPDGERYAFRIGDAWVFRHVATDGDWVQVETLPEFDGREHCYGTASGFRSFRLRFFVKAEDVALTPTHEITQRFEDGTSLRIQPGVAFFPADNGYVATLRGVRFKAHLSAAELGQTYQPVQRLSSPREGRYLPFGSQLRFSGNLVLENEPPQAQPTGLLAALGASRDNPDVPGRIALRVAENEALLGVTTRCAEIQALRGDVRPTSQRPRTGGAGGLSGNAGPRIAAGTPLYYPDGSSAGESVRPTVFNYGAGEINGRRCFDLLLVSLFNDPGRANEAHSLRVCVDADQVRGPEPHRLGGLR